MADPNGTNNSNQARYLRRIEFRATCRSRDDATARLVSGCRLHGPDAGHAALPPLRQRPSWRDEFGTADDPDDFAALAKYSPYQQVRDGVAYPATMIVSGDADRNCNPLHARKMTARLQAANSSERPMFLDYSKFRGHSPVLPLSARIDALTDRMAFLCDQLHLPV